MAKLSEAEAKVTQMPQHVGDGYSWGGDYVLTIGATSVVFGPDDSELVHEIAARWNSGRQALSEGNSK